jgi:phenylacetate-CoA ligase
MKIHPSEIRSVEDLEGLPLIDKEMFRKDPAYFVSTTRRGKNAVPFSTSGSTATPTKIYHDRYSLLVNIALGEREREVISKFCGQSFGYRIVFILTPESTSKKVQDLYRRWTFIPIRPVQFELSLLSPVEEVIESINRLRPDVLTGYASYLETFFRTLSSRRISIHRPRVLVSLAETMTPEGKTLIEDEFGIPVISQYNAMEAFKIGFTCEERKGFHFVNHGTVLLNYRLGDVGSLSREKCPCGRTLPLLSEVEGRIEDILFLPDGRFIHPRAIWVVIRNMEGVLKYQFIQHEPKRFELRLVTVDKATYLRIVDRILDGLKNMLGTSVTIESQYVEEIKPQEGGKFRPVLSLCKPR